MLPPNEMWQFNELLRTGDYAHYKGRKVNVRFKVVCGTCNNDWMSELENEHAKTAMERLLIGNNSAVLSLKNIVSIAAYAFKTTVIANHKQLLGRSPFFTPAERFRFRTTLQIPDGIQIWIACRKSTHYTGVCTSSRGEFNKKSSHSFSYYVCTWNFVNVVLQLFAARWDNKRRRQTIPFPGIPQDSYWREASIPIWPPPATDIEWPPPKFIGDNTFDTFRDRWDSIHASVLANIMK